jgi:hypothetical protein
MDGLSGRLGAPHRSAGAAPGPAEARAAEPVSCERGGSTSEFVVSFSLHPDGDAVRMICAGVCCLSDGMPGSSAGWDIRDHPGLHLLGQA